MNLQWKPDINRLTLIEQSGHKYSYTLFKLHIHALLLFNSHLYASTTKCHVTINIITSLSGLANVGKHYLSFIITHY